MFALHYMSEVCAAAGAGTGMMMPNRAIVAAEPGVGTGGGGSLSVHPVDSRYRASSSSYRPSADLTAKVVQVLELNLLTGQLGRFAVPALAPSRPQRSRLQSTAR